MAGTARVAVRSLKLAVSAVVWLTDRLGDGLCRIAGRAVPGRAVVLYYHGILASERAGFARQMEVVAARARAVGADHEAPLDPGRLYAVITFDDGFVSVLENAVPELERRGLPAMMFVPTGHIGQAPGWLKRPELIRRGERVMTAEELRLAQARGLAMGAHTVNHRRLDRLTPEEVACELGQSRQDLEAVVSGPVNVVSFPHGAHHGGVLEEARRQGFRRVYGIHPACVRGRFPEGCVGRVSVDPADWAVEFRLKLEGAYRWLDRSRRLPDS